MKFVTLRGFTFRHATRTFMENREPILRSDWTVYRGGAVLFNGAEDCAVEDCDFDQLGGNAIFVNAYNRRITVRGCLIQDSWRQRRCLCWRSAGGAQSALQLRCEIRLRQAGPHARARRRMIFPPTVWWRIA